MPSKSEPWPSIWHLCLCFGVGQSLYLTFRPLSCSHQDMQIGIGRTENGNEHDFIDERRSLGHRELCYMADFTHNPAETSQLPASILCHRLLEPIATCPQVSRVVVFGSLAGDAADAYSDVDLLVAVEDEQAAWDVTSIIRRTLQVLFYRMFSSDRQPAGRYWFAGQSPLTRLDISFHTPEQLAMICQTRMYQGHPIACRELYRREPVCRVSSDVTSASSQLQLPLQITELEAHFGSCIYRLSRAISCAMRSQPYRHRLEDCVQDLQQAMTQTQTHRLAGGDGHALGHALLQLVKTLALDHAADV